VAEGKDFVLAQADGGPWKAWCVTTPTYSTRFAAP
jgi:hypothetical protein